jgi:hypothetical protein
MSQVAVVSAKIKASALLGGGCRTWFGQFFAFFAVSADGNLTEGEVQYKD